MELGNIVENREDNSKKYFIAYGENFNTQSINLGFETSCNNGVLYLVCELRSGKIVDVYSSNISLLQDYKKSDSKIVTTSSLKDTAEVLTPDYKHEYSNLIEKFKLLEEYKNSLVDMVAYLKDK